MEEDKRKRDEFGELYQDAFTENESKPRGAVREEVEETLKLDPNVDSQEDDEAMAENRFGVNQPKSDK
jgi:hypothetical protein